LRRARDGVRLNFDTRQREALVTERKTGPLLRINRYGLSGRSRA
jgi:hypothetical protein